MDYCIILGFILASTFFLYVYSKTKKKIMLFFLLGLIVVVCAMREVIPGIKNSDAYVYKVFYERAFGKSFADYLISIGSNEVVFYGFFWVCAKMGLAYDIVRIIYYTLMFVGVLGIVKENRIEYNNYFDLMFIMSNFVLANCLMRNCMAYVIGWLTISLINNKKYIRSIILGIIAVFIHNSAIIILIYIMFRMCISIIKNVRYLIFFMCILYIGSSYVIPLIMNYIGSFNEKMAYYLDITTGSIAIATTAIRLISLILLLFLYHSKVRYYNDESYKNILLLCVFSMVVVLMQLSNGIAYRFLAYFDILFIMLFGYIRSAQRNRNVTVDGYEIINHFLSAIGIFVLILFIDNSLLGYGLIPIKW